MKWGRLVRDGRVGREGKSSGGGIGGKKGTEKKNKGIGLVCNRQ